MIQHLEVTPAVLQYIRAHSLREPRFLSELREETAQLAERNMQVLAEQGQFLNLLIKLMNAKRALEIGVFTGYSAICIALGLPADGLLTACDCNEQWLDIAQRYWRQAHLAERIQLCFGEALPTLESLLKEFQRHEFYDFVFIDADKVNYDHYYEYALKLTRPGGLIVLDNTLWSGKVVDESAADLETQALQKLNQKIFKDERVDISMLPFADGLTLACKR